MKRSILAVLAVLTLAGPASAADLNSLEIRGNVVRMDVVTQGGSYQESLLWVRDLDPSAPLQPILLRCDAAAGGSLANCSSPYAVFACPLAHTVSHDIYTPSVQTDSYSCASSARVGLCLDLAARVRPLDAFVYGVNIGGREEPIQALSLDVLDVGFGSGCAS